MDLDFMLGHLPRLLKATTLTIQLTLLSLFFGIFVGVFFAILRTSKNKILYSPTDLNNFVSCKYHIKNEATLTLCERAFPIQ